MQLKRFRAAAQQRRPVTAGHGGWSCLPPTAAGRPLHIESTTRHLLAAIPGRERQPSALPAGRAKAVTRSHCRIMLMPVSNSGAWQVVVLLIGRQMI